MFRTRNIIGKIGFIVFALYISIAGVGVANAKLIFQDDSVGTYESETIKIGSNDAGATNTALQFGADSTGSENGNIAWNIGSNTFGIDHTVDITGGLSATGQVNFSGAAGFRMRETANHLTAACTTINELVLNTTNSTIYKCTVVNNPGTWVSTAAAGSTPDFEGVYTQDAGKDLVTGNAAFTITTGTNDFIVDSNDWNVDASGNLDGNNITANGTLDANGVATIGDNGDTITLDSSDWDINATGDMTGIGAINMDGLLTGTAGATLSGATINLNNNSNFDVNIGTGTSTGTVTLGGTGTQTIAVGSGAGAKTVNVGSSLTTSTTNILSGSGAVNVNAGNNQPTNINTGGSSGLVSIGGGSGTIAIDTTNWDISSAGAATGLTGITSTGNINFSGNTTTFRMPSGTNAQLPGTCTEGMEYYDTTNHVIQVCVSGTNTWRPQGTTSAGTNGGVLYGNSSTGTYGFSAAGSAGQVLQSNGSGAPTWTTATYPATAGAAGTILRSNGTNGVYSTSTFADTYTASNLLYSNGANTVQGLATANNGVLVTNDSGVPSISSNLPAGIKLAAGGGTATAYIGGGLFSDSTTYGNTNDTNEDTMTSYSLPANTLSINNQGIHVRVYGMTASNSHNKTIKLYFGATVIASLSNNSSGKAWYFDAYILRKTATTQTAMGLSQLHSDTTVAVSNTAPAETLSNAVIIKTTAQTGTAAANDITQTGIIVEYIGQ